MNMRLVGYECNMVMRWVDTLYSWVEYDELVWIWPGTRKGIGYEGWHDLYTCM